MYQQQLNLFGEQESCQAKIVINLDGEAIFYRTFFTIEESDQFFCELENSINWRQDHIKLYGKSIDLPRLTAWYGDEGKSYIYSGIEQHPSPWTPTLKKIKSRIEEVANVKFNSVLLNFYRSGKDSVSWHSDDEPELGINPIIGSVSFGGTRRFCLKHKNIPERKVDIELPHGSFLLMKGEIQHHWLHQIPKTQQAVKPRINLTFRIIN
ncbi:alpha-ketoglutarate-dependent dioxygenase AlkB [Crocosphaera sp. UHCC 0190]|uniref:alpha-ketoglutarate-dependent dioxygenase AlkB family protein n=1 Tax=Crocosphaera sp. UHCC 0190 TaxID=3110246 RepID=UPI002B1F61EC|nr:alpha-ketoglutarate-dependent dioxygenase AlkB [Crocosphaera sp. UHCC 0190]MEA5509860.1 alpha-ketoglutarate-dependent dioxygenase AlkB [Crocosphaera sp. UHCC 0190]